MQEILSHPERSLSNSSNRLSEVPLYPGFSYMYAINQFISIYTNIALMIQKYLFLYFCCLHFILSSVSVQTGLLSK